MPGRRQALLIGNSYFPRDPNLLDLYGPLNDLSNLLAVLTSEEFGTFDAADVKVLAERESHEIVDALRTMCENAHKNDTLLIYYSGHGLPGEPGTGSLLLSARDTVTFSAAATAVSFAEIQDVLNHCPAGAVVVILDCCFSGGAKAVLNTRELAGRGRFIVTAARAKQPAHDAADVRGVSRFTEHLLVGLCGAAARGDVGEITIGDLYDYVYEQMLAEQGATPTRSFDGYGHVVLTRVPEFVHEARAAPRRRLVATAPASVRAFGRWALALLLLLLVLVGSAGLSRAATELAYRAKWPLSDGVGILRASLDENAARLPRISALGPAFVQTAPLLLGLAAGIFVCAAFLSRILGGAWWIPPPLLVLWAASDFFAGLNHYYDNTAAILVPAVIMILSAKVFPPSDRRDVRKTRVVVIGIALAWLPAAFITYRWGGIYNWSRTVEEFLTFAALKDATTVDRTFWVWITGVTGFAVGAVIVHWTLRWIPVLGRSRASRGVSRPWLRRTVFWSVMLTTVPAAVTLTVSSYLNRIDNGLDSPAMIALAEPWFPYADDCDDGTCAMGFVFADSGTAELSFFNANDPEEARRDVLSLGPDNPAYQGTYQGYTYAIGKYDGHDGSLIWTHAACSCWARIRVHNNEESYEAAVKRFHEFTDVPVPEP